MMKMEEIDQLMRTKEPGLRYSVSFNVACGTTGVLYLTVGELYSLSRELKLHHMKNPEEYKLVVIYDKDGYLDRFECKADNNALNIFYREVYNGHSTHTSR